MVLAKMMYGNELLTGSDCSYEISFSSVSEEELLQVTIKNEGSVKFVFYYLKNLHDDDHTPSNINTIW